MATDNEIELENATIEDGDYVVKSSGDVFQVDFDNNKTVYKRSEDSEPPSKKKKDKSGHKLKKKKKALRKDLTKKQVEENYWKTTPLTKLDGSTAMMETRVHKCQEASDNTKSRKACQNEVKPRMIKAGSENTNTDMNDSKEDVIVEDAVAKKKDQVAKKKDAVPKKKDQVVEAEVEEEETVDVCKKKLDMLEKFYEENKSLQDEVKDMRKDFLKIKAEREAEKAKAIENKRQVIIKDLVENYLYTEDEFKEDSLDDLEKTQRRLDMAIKKDIQEAEKENTEDLQGHIDLFDAKVKQAYEDDFLKI